MSLESLFQHIVYTEHWAEQSRRVLREVKSEVTRCRENIKKTTEVLKEEKIKLESKEVTKRKVTEEEEKFIKEITDFNNEYEITKKREIFVKENVKIEISNLENQANVLKRVLEDEENEAICTTKYLQAEKLKISEKPQNDAECLRLKRELELYKEDDMESVYEALQTEIEFLELVLLQAEDINCINLDWINGSLKYIHAVNNLRVAGAEVAYFIDVLMKKFGYSPSKVHLIGHSVGAHLAGDAGSRIPGLGRITGLDPAGPFFHNSPKEFRLDPSDASFVDVIHTNAVPILFKLGWQHKLSIKLSGNKVTQGSIFLRIGGTIGKTGETVIFSGELKPGMIYTKLIDVDMNVGNITSIEFIWNKHLLGYSQDKLGAEIVTDISGKYGYKSTFCSWNITGPNTVQILKPC
ncbi:hypothetical protein TREES_T100020248 [Tupaia chinensis]|uniref:Coiled-coil domain-containing protein 172 n=1 Tax=Tupaia chinensis TaxID=246437 RepID=L9L7T7_TUPCH|nr:hypothetical protein TREES_T100020248 [Tupaia chinensis]